MDEISFGAFRVLTGSRELWAGGRRAQIGSRALEVLIALARRRGELVTKAELAREVWGVAEVEDNTIAAQVSALRRALGGGDEAQRLVETVPGRGYRFVAPQSDSLGGEIGGDTALAKPVRSRPTAAMLSGAAAVLVSATLALVRLPPPTPAAPAATPTRVAVQPFDVFSASPAARDFAGALQDELVGALANDQVTAVPRADGVALRGPDAEQAAMRLGVGFVLDGSVESDGAAIHVRVHLDDVRQHMTLWSRDFAGPVAQAESLEAEVADHATILTKWVFLPGMQHIRGRPAILAEFLTGSDDFTLSGDGRRAQALFRDVTAAAPDFSYGHAMLGYTLREDAANAPAADQTRFLDEARHEDELAHSLDPTDADALDGLASLRPMSDWAGREALRTKSLGVDTTLPFAPVGDSAFLAQVGRENEAVVMARRAVALDPFWTGSRAALALRLANVGKVDDALASLTAAERLRPGLPDWRVYRYEFALDAGDAAAALRWLADPVVSAWQSNGNALAPIRLSLRAHKSGRGADRRMAIVAATAALARGEISPIVAAAIFSAQGDQDRALAAAAIYATPDALAAPEALGRVDTSILFGPLLKNMRRDPRFLVLVARIGLIDYWRRSGRWPDFCADPKLPYDCQTEAARLLRRT